jgi:DNA/RNA endonuclease G (NUC1)
MMRGYIVPATLGLALCCMTSAIYGTVVVGDTPLATNPQVFVGLPVSSKSTSITVSRKQYVVSWDYESRAPEWAAWVLNKRELGAVTRTNTFRLDHDLDEALVSQNRESVTPNDYRGSCLDRGHQVPSGDRTAITADNEATFFMSNILPQSAFLNRRSWVSLERFLRRQVLNHNKHVQIYAGSVPNRSFGTIGPGHDIAVPLKNFKIAVLMPATRQRPRIDQMQYFVANFPNVTSRNTDPVIDHEQACFDSDHTIHLDDGNQDPLWRPFLSTLSTVQGESGIDFSFLQGAHALTRAEVDLLISSDSMPGLAK